MGLNWILIWLNLLWTEHDFDLIESPFFLAWTNLTNFCQFDKNGSFFAHSEQKNCLKEKPLKTKEIGYHFISMGTFILSDCCQLVCCYQTEMSHSLWPILSNNLNEWLQQLLSFFFSFIRLNYEWLQIKSSAHKIGLVLSVFLCVCVSVFM